MSSAYGWAGVALGVLLILGTLWAFVRWIRKAGMDRQKAEDAIRELQQKKAELEAKLRAAIAALEVLREAKRDPAGLPADLGVQPREKPIGGRLGKPANRPEASAAPDTPGL